MRARIIRWPHPDVWRLLGDLVTIAGLVAEAIVRRDRGLLVDCARWHDACRDALARLRIGGMRDA